MGFYEGSPARERALAAPRVDAPETGAGAAPAPPLPVDAAGGGSDTNDGSEAAEERVWTRQTPLIEIDEDGDYVSDDGAEVHGVFRSRGVRHVVMTGVHTNMCVLKRPFAIVAMKRRGFDVMLCRDLTDAMYDPAAPPYVSHEEGTALVVGYIEAFHCPTVPASDLEDRAGRAGSDS
jgi:hypothetical protein